MEEEDDSSYLLMPAELPQFRRTTDSDCSVGATRLDESDDGMNPLTGEDRDRIYFYSGQRSKIIVRECATMRNVGVCDVVFDR